MKRLLVQKFKLIGFCTVADFFLNIVTVLKQYIGITTRIKSVIKNLPIRKLTNCCFLPTGSKFPMSHVLAKLVVVS